MVNDNVTSLASGLGSDNALGRNNLASEGCLVLVNINGDSGLIPVGTGLEEVLLTTVDGKEGTSSNNGSSASSDNVLGGVGSLDNLSSLLGGKGTRRDGGSRQRDGTNSASSLF